MIDPNPFSRHGIDHLSPSALNLWAAEPALWVMERLLGRRSPISANAARGKAVEHGIHLGLMTPDLPVVEAAIAAQRAFDREMTLNPNARRETERKTLAGYVEHGLKELRQYGAPSAYQEKVSISLDEVPVPIIGYIDWRFDRHGLVVDLKTAKQLPSSIRDSHGRQGAVYAKAHDNYGMRFAYVKPVAGKKDGRAVAVYETSGDLAQRIEMFAHLIAARLVDRDGARLSYALWKVNEESSRALCLQLGLEYENGLIVNGAVVKANDETNLAIQTYVRQPTGLLVDCSDRIEAVSAPAGGDEPDDARELTTLMLDEIERAWNDKAPYSDSPQARDRYVLTQLPRRIGRRKAEVERAYLTLMNSGHVRMEHRDRHANLRGLRVVRRMDELAERLR